MGAIQGEKMKEFRELHRDQVREARDKLHSLNEFKIRGNDLNWTTPNAQFYGYFDKGGMVNDRLRKAFEEELLEDGLISSTKSYHFEISSKKLMVNKKEVDASFLEKYKAIYEDISGFQLRGKDRIVIDTIKEE